MTIAGGSLFGMVGLILAAPLTSAAVHVSRKLALARAGQPGPQSPPARAGLTDPDGRGPRRRPRVGALTARAGQCGLRR